VKRPRKPSPSPLDGMRPESLMMSHGYHPEWSEGAVKPPIFQTSTFAFPSAEAGKQFFAWAYGLEDRDPALPMGLIYSRLNNPDLEILEARLNLWDGGEQSAVFSSGMAALSTSLLALVGPGESVAFSRPVYGGTDYLMEELLPGLGIPARDFPAGADAEVVEGIFCEQSAAGRPVRVLFLETPANPTMTLTDIETMSAVAHRHGAIAVVDNTFLGPLYQHPLQHGADLVVYSATKYLGGHSDLVAGVAIGPRTVLGRVRLFRTILGTMLDPHSAWLLLRSLETAKLRITCQRKNAERVARWLAGHPLVSKLYYPGQIEDPVQKEIYRKQCSGPGAMLAFEIKDAGEAETFRFLNAVRLIKLAVSLGGTESLIEHPASMTHADVPRQEQIGLGITPGLVRLSIGIEHPEDLIADLAFALSRVETGRQPMEGAAEPIPAHATAEER
jgi:methionine-gamma-lyase